MKRMSWLLIVICWAFTYDDAIAQDVWVALPGDNFSSHYGIDLGNGLGFGYVVGFGGTGVNDWTGAAASSYTGYQPNYGYPNTMFANVPPMNVPILGQQVKKSTKMKASAKAVQPVSKKQKQVLANSSNH